MVLKNNKYYWEESLRNPEKILDDYYAFDDIIIEDKETLEKIDRLRELITCYCILIKKDENSANKILDEIYQIITSFDKVQYTEFVAFWKVMDISYSVFKKIPNKESILKGLLGEYCKKRRKIYEKLGYSNVTVQALYDSGSSRKKGMSGIRKLINLVEKSLRRVEYVQDYDIMVKTHIGYFLPDKKDNLLFEKFCEKFEIRYEYGRTHQGKMPDMVLKVDEDFYIIEAKHVKESGGAQDKQVLELIEFIKYCESSDYIHYLSFMDGLYFNFFIYNKEDNKIAKQKKEIEEYLNKYKNNFFVNTAGFEALLRDIAKKIKD